MAAGAVAGAGRAPGVRAQYSPVAAAAGVAVDAPVSAAERVSVGASAERAAAADRSPAGMSHFAWCLWSPC